MSTMLENISRVFGAKPTEQEQDDLAAEVMLMTLSRATAADSRILDVEVERVRAVLEEKLNKVYSSADIRVAANSEIYEVAPLRQYLASVAGRMREADKVQTIQALADVINVDGRVSAMEVDFFNDVASALALTPAQIMGLLE